MCVHYIIIFFIFFHTRWNWPVKQLCLGELDWFNMEKSKIPCFVRCIHHMRQRNYYGKNVYFFTISHRSFARRLQEKPRNVKISLHLQCRKTLEIIIECLFYYPKLFANAAYARYMRCSATVASHFFLYRICSSYIFVLFWSFFFILHRPLVWILILFKLIDPCHDMLK